MTDAVFTSIPFTDTTMPLMAPAILKSIAEKAGKKSVALDLNIKYLKKILHHEHKDLLLLFFKDGVLDPMVADVIEDMLDSIVDDILIFNPSYVGLSVFTYDCRVSAKFISWKIRQKNPNVKIILGGPGLFENLTGGTDLGEDLVRNNVIDFYIRGDGEKPIYEYFANNNLIVGVNSNTWLQMINEELDQLPPPNYEDYDFSLYPNGARVPILGSRGCVRKCTFCDIHAHWENFTFRDGEKIFDEMIRFSETYGYRRFKFQDSLINGNMKQYRKLTRLLTDYNQKNPEKSLSWNSFFIFKPKKHFTEEDWYYTGGSGADNLMIGIESLSEQARYHLGKQFSNDDIDFGLEMIRKYGCRTTLLFLIGYITETEQDIKEAVQWWEDHKQYNDIAQVNLGTPLGVLRNTPLEKEFENLNLKWVGPNDTDWVNENSNPQTRARWYRQLSKTLKKCGFYEVHPFDNHYILERIENGRFDNTLS